MSARPSPATRRTTPLARTILERVHKGEIPLPLLPDVAARVLGLQQEDDCDARELADLIHGDPSLAAHVLRVSNSPLYMPSEPIVSLQQAVTRLGIDTVAEIAVSIAVRGRIFSVPGYEDLLVELWTHSALAGAYARAVARLRRANVEGAFLAGLLHDVGRPVALQVVLDFSEEKHLGLGESQVLALVDEVHAALGAILVERWTLPAWMGVAARYHHDPEAAPAGVDSARVACAADVLAHWATDADDATPPPRHAVFGALNLYEEDIDELVRLRDDVLQTVETFQ